MKSLRGRALAGAAVWATVVTLAGTSAVGGYLDSLTVSRFDETLAARHSQTVVALANSGGDGDAMPQQLPDPIYQSPFSGNYWQAVSDDGRIIVSRSIADVLLSVTPAAGGFRRVQNIAGPAGQNLRAISQNVTLDDGTTWTVTVASTTRSIEADRKELRRRLNISLSLVGLLATVGALLIVLFTLRPLSQLRRDVTARQDHGGELPVQDYPQEVQSLVRDINALLERNRDIVERSRRQTADLAHALKTPSAVLRNELFELQEDGVEVQSGIKALDRLDAQLKRAFARMKASQDSASERETTNLDVSLGRLGRAFAALAKNNQREIVLEIEAGLHAKINQIDFEEILGNLLDNALKWSALTIKLSAMSEGDRVRIIVEDDGTGFGDDRGCSALVSGRRLDESKPGMGLGLAIASDLIAAYRGKIALGQSATLGGAMVVVELRRAI